MFIYQELQKEFQSFHQRFSTPKYQALFILLGFNLNFNVLGLSSPSCFSKNLILYIISHCCPIKI